MKTNYVKKDYASRIAGILIILFFMSSATYSQSVYWATYLRTPSIAFDREDMAEAIAVDNITGDVYMTGRTNSILKDNTGTYVAVPPAAQSSGVSYLVKYDSCGNFQWITYLGNQNNSCSSTNNSCIISSVPPNHGCSEWAYCLAIDHNGENTFIFVGGEIMEGDGGASQLLTATGGAEASHKDRWDGFVAKYNDAGVSQGWTYISGSNRISGSCNNVLTGSYPTVDQVLGIGVADFGDHDVYITGYSESDNLADTDNDAATVYAGESDGNDIEVSHEYTPGDGGDCFIARLNNTLTSLYDMEYFGGDGNDRGHAIKIYRDAAGFKHVVVGGTTQSTGIMAGGYDLIRNNQDAFVVKWKTSGFSSGASPSWSTYVGGDNSERGRGLDVDADGNIYVTGWTNSTTGLGADGTSWQTALGGGSGNDAFIGKIKKDGSALRWMTYYGGSAEERPNALKVYTSGTDNYIVVSGSTKGSLPSLVNPVQSTFGGGVRDAFVIKLKDCETALCSGKKQNLEFSTYMGGAAQEFDESSNPNDNIFNSYGPCLDLSPDNKSIYVSYSTKSSPMIFTPTILVSGYNGGTGANAGDAFIAKIVPAGYGNPCTGGNRFNNVHGSTENTGIQLYPNPFSSSFTCTFYSPAIGNSAIEIYNINGGKVLTENITYTEGENNFIITVKDLPAGVYEARVYINGSSFHSRIVKQ